MLYNYVPKQAAENVAFDASAQSTAAPAGTNAARIVATEDCYIDVGSNPTAAAGDRLLPAGVVEFIPLAAGLKIAAVKVTTAGILNVCFVDG